LQRIPIIVTTQGALRALVREEIDAALLRAKGSEAADWLDAQGVAKLLGIHARSVQKLASRSGLPAHRFGAKLLRYRRSEVERWAEERGRTVRP
jgi:excisionase family DNA binding protein